MPSGEGSGPSTLLTPGNARIRVAASSKAALAATGSSGPDGDVTSTRSTDGSVGKFPLLTSCSARPVSPMLPALVAFVVPTMFPMAMHAATSTTHSTMARHGWVALQRATRTVSGLRSTSSRLTSSSPHWASPTAAPAAASRPSTLTLGRTTGPAIRHNTGPVPDVDGLTWFTRAIDTGVFFGIWGFCDSGLSRSPFILPGATLAAIHARARSPAAPPVPPP